MDQVEWLSINDQRTANISILIVSWNVKDVLMKNLTALFESQGNFLARVILIDNDSTDGTVQTVERLFPFVQIIANHHNLGFSKANNQGLAIANSRHVLLLNPDMMVTPNALEQTLKYLDSYPEVGVLGARLEDENGSVFPSVRRFPDIKSQLVILFKLQRLFPGLIKKYLWNNFDNNLEQDVPQVRGSYFAISKNALARVPKLDERYFIWFEEVDYCREIYRKGLKVRFVPSIIACDFGSKSFAQRDSFWRFKHFSKSMYLYFRKWEPSWQANAIGMFRIFLMPLVWLTTKIR